jgi:predicted transport protein
VASTSAAATSAEGEEISRRGTASDRTVAQLHERAPKDLKNLYDALDAYLLSLGDDVTKTARKNYYAYRRIKNFACVEIHPQTRKLLVYLKTDPKAINLEPGFTRDMSTIGHFGTGDLEVSIGNHGDFERAQSFIVTSYQAS